jgi:hypothetical protein
MVGSAGAGGGASAAVLARAHGAEAHRLAMVAGADAAAATRAALHAVVIGAVKGGAARQRPAVLALARSWALSSAGAGSASAASGAGEVASAFWALPEPLRSALWCQEALGLRGRLLEQVVPGVRHEAAVARGRIRRAVCRRHREEAEGTACAPTAEVLHRVLAGSATGQKAALVDAHVAGCDRCDRLLAALRSPVAAVEAGLPRVPDLVVPAQKAWREHVGAPLHPLADQTRRLASAAPRRQRTVAVALAVLTAGSFGAATSQLATATELPSPLLAAPVAAPVRRAPKPVRVVRPPQAVVAPLAEGVVLDPFLATLVTPDLTQVTPVTVPAPPPPAPAPPPAVDALAAGIAEPPPAVDRTRTYDLGVPFVAPLPLRVDVGPCTRISVGPLRITLPCDR